MYVKALLVGDAEVGKSPLARCAAGGSGQTDWDGYPTYQGLDIAEVSVSKRSPWALMDERRGKGKGKRTRKLALQDEMQRIQMPIWILHPVFDEMMPRMRSVTFQGVEVVGICYKVTDRDSLENAIHKWFPMIRHYQPSVPVLLIGCMSDAKVLDPCHTPVSEEEAKKASREIGAVQWLEWTSVDRRSAEKVTQALGWYGYHYAQSRQYGGKCVIL